MLDLWSIEVEQLNQLRVPAMILSEQAKLLGQKTKNIITARILPLDPPEHNLFKQNGGETNGSKPGTFYYAFIFAAPILNNYRYHLFTISHPIDLYPIRFNLDDEIKEEIGVDKDKPLLAASEEEFTNILAKIFKAPKTRRIIQSMYAQSQVYKAA